MHLDKSVISRLKYRLNQATHRLSQPEVQKPVTKNYSMRRPEIARAITNC